MTSSLPGPDYIPGWPSKATRATAVAAEWRKQDLAGVTELPHQATRYASSALRWGASPVHVAQALALAYVYGGARAEAVAA